MQSRFPVSAQAFIVSTIPTGLLTSRRQICGGVIIGSQTILTTAHCLLDETTRATDHFPRAPLPVSRIQVVVGALDSDAPASNVYDPTHCAQTFTVKSATTHPAYNDTVKDNDIGIITLTTAINVDQKPCACTLCFSSRQPAVGEMCAVTGFGFPDFTDGGALVCWDPINKVYYLAGVIAVVDDFCIFNLHGNQNTKVALYLQWISDNALSGDINVFPNPTVTPPTTVPPGTTNTPTPPTATPEACGIPGNGQIDAFGIALVVVSQGNGRKTTCGGIIIGTRTILTAGTCMVTSSGVTISSASAYTVTVGAVDSSTPSSNAQDVTGCAQTFTVQNVTLHPGYVFATDDNDIGILTLSSAIDLVNKPCACAICLAYRVPAFNDTCVISGYGTENNGKPIRNAVPLKWTTQKIIPQSGSCAVFCSGSTCTNVSNYLCSQGATGQDQCIGDNGGPLVCYDPTRNNYYLAGVMAFTSETCGSGQGGQSTAVTLYLSWIVANALPGDVQVESRRRFGDPNDQSNSLQFPVFVD
ncbi:transmembrane protease serine 9-like [Paramacrobiotus metropolitanus]|uniref:transmembrane protease serine 9-like n=1 Tax=Paramacrobiotus metropolitanus TaxID=2943436 RepID=UPI0024463928|nr:transmembrane protease serine 9-like [Paramacrobiotus metropolitanus]